MKIPKTFIPEKSLEKNIEEMLNSEKVLKYREIEDAFSLLDLPENIKDYSTKYKKLEDKKIPAYAWCNHFGKLFFTYLVEAGKISYFKGLSASRHIISIYSLNFSSDSELDELIKTVDITQEFIDDEFKEWTVQYLKKDNYMIALFLNKEMTNDLNFFKEWYVDNFGMVEI